MASKAQYNVGTFKGYNGIAVLYLCKTSGGVEFLSYKTAVTVGSTTTEHWSFMPKSALQSYMSGNDATISSNVVIATLAEKLPDGSTDSNGYPIIDNGDTLPRLYTSQAFYSLKGDDIATYTGAVGTITSGSKDGTGSTVVINSAAKTISESLSEAVTWATTNWFIVLIILVIGLTLFGVINIPGISSKKKRVAARRR